MNNYTVVREVLCNKYQSRNLIGHYHFWGISPRYPTMFTRPFLTGRRVRAGHETKYMHGLKEQNGSQPEKICFYVNLGHSEFISWESSLDQFIKSTLIARFHLNPVVTNYLYRQLSVRDYPLPLQCTTLLKGPRYTLP